MADRDYHKYTYEQLYNQTQDLIVDYAFDRKERTLTEIFHLVIYLSSQIIMRFYKNKARDAVFLEDVSTYVAEQITLKIWKRPWHFFKQDDISGYLRVTVRNAVTMHHRDQRRFTSGVVYINDIEQGSEQLWEMLGVMQSPEERVLRYDQVRHVVRVVAQTLRSTVRFQDRWQGLMWPVLQAIITQNDRILDSLSYQDRLGLRVVLIRCEALLTPTGLERIVKQSDAGASRRC